jgi:pimeloyl-ACP methyl ester carboxylesterase
MKKLSIFFLAIIFLSCQLYSQKAKTLPVIVGKFVLVDNHKMHYQVAGVGSPTVVFEGGVTDNLNSWNPVFTEVAKFARTVRYDRMGLGASDTTIAPRSFKQIATELHSLLQNAKLSPPYILVGHSMAGGMIRAFAHLYKNEIAGMVFIDCMTEFDVNGFPPDSVEKNLPPGLFARRSTPQESELYLLRTEVLSGYTEMKSFDPLPDVPIHVFVGQKNIYPLVANNRMEWYQRSVADKTESSLTVLPASSHYIHRDYPGKIVTTIHQMLFTDPDAALRKVLQEQGVDSCIARYKKMKTVYPEGSITEGTLNKLGYELVRKKDFKGAIRLFELNTMMYPNSFNVFDSLGDAYMNAGDKNAAIKNYSRSLKMNPQNKNAQMILNRLNEAK